MHSDTLQTWDPLNFSRSQANDDEDLNGPQREEQEKITSVLWVRKRDRLLLWVKHVRGWLHVWIFSF